MSRTRTLKVNRIDVIGALITEPLSAGKWVENPYRNEVGDCQVCAVGAYLRRQRKTNCQIDRIGEGLGSWVGTSNDIHRALEDQHYLQALSIYFERLMRSLPNPPESRLMMKDGNKFRRVETSELNALGIPVTNQDSVQRPVTLEDRARLVRFVLRQFPESFVAEYQIGAK